MRFVCLVLLIALPLGAQGHPSRSSASSSATHRVVVVNGEKIVDERTVDGKRVPGGGGGTPVLGDAEAMLRDMMRRMRDALPPDARDLCDGIDPASGGAARASHSRRVVVRDGEVVVDEETRDGVPVRRPAGARGVPGSARAEARASAGSTRSGDAPPAPRVQPARPARTGSR